MPNTEERDRTYLYDVIVIRALQSPKNSSRHGRNVSRFDRSTASEESTG